MASEPSRVRSRRSTDAKNVSLVLVLVPLCAAAFFLDTLLLRKMLEMHMNDFCKFYYSARAFFEGRDMYAPSPGTNIGTGAAADLQFLNLNPPHFHLVVLPFAMMPPDLAVVLWVAVSLAALMISLVLIGRELGVAWTPLRVFVVAFAVLAFSGTQAFFLTGQVSMLLMLAMTLAWLDARRGRWPAAAIWLGLCLSVKPFVAIFVPYLIATRRYRAAAISLATAAAAFMIGLLVFGLQNVQSWARAVAQSADWTWAEMNASLLGFFRRAF